MTLAFEPTRAETVILTQATIGQGVSGHPIRTLNKVLTLDGELIMQHDPYIQNIHAQVLKELKVFQGAFFETTVQANKDDRAKLTRSLTTIHTLLQNMAL